ncbi:MAG: preprotein translocase subunit SecG [Clostridia bacterium]|nr:preprotein translocase subunit SecG [Clostridia bacterium]
MQIAIGIVLIIAAVFLVVSVLMQSGKSHNLSGTIAGGAETFFGKAKGSTIDKKLSKLTTIVAIVFVVLVLVSYLMQDTVDLSDLQQSISDAEITAGTTETEDAAEGAAEGEAASEDGAAEGAEG